MYDARTECTSHRSSLGQHHGGSRIIAFITDGTSSEVRRYWFASLAEAWWAWEHPPECNHVRNSGKAATLQRNGLH
jgi:hypothetical protein